MSDAKRSAEELLEHRDDPGEWSDEAEPIEVRSSTEVVSFRLPPEEVDMLVDAAHSSHETLSEYVRKAIGVRLFGEPVGPAVEVSSGGGTLVIRSHIVTSGRRDAPASFVPDTPPLTQNVA
jgi:hypothetical protein